jgi:N-acetylglucosamine malate deacetylase 1
MKDKILVVASHPDDEFLGCGGTLINHRKKGDEIGIQILSEGSTSRDKKRNKLKRKKELEGLKTAAIKVSKQIKGKFIKFNSFPDNRMDSVDFLDVVKKIESTIKIFKPNIIYTHHPSDLNIDHTIVHRAVITAARPIPKSSIKKILMFEIMSSTNWSTKFLKPKYSFNPNYFVDISDTLKEKLQILKFYESEMKNWPHSRSIKGIKALANYRGSSVGVKAAEAFELVRSIKKNK